jgi:hypothetical protein
VEAGLTVNQVPLASSLLGKIGYICGYLSDIGMQMGING